MRPNSGDTITCPCTYSQTPLPMAELDRDSNPGPKTWVPRDQFRGRRSVARPYATPHSIVSIAPRGDGFEALMAELGIVTGSVNPRVLGWVANGSGSG